MNGHDTSNTNSKDNSNENIDSNKNENTNDKKEKEKPFVSKVSVWVAVFVLLLVYACFYLWFCSLVSRSVHARCFRNAETFLIFF